MRFPCRLTVLLLLILVWGSSQALAQGQGRLMTPATPLNVRAKPQLDGAYVTTLLPGEVVRVHGEKGGWASVFRPETKGFDSSQALGYVKIGFLKPVEQDAASSESGDEPSMDAGPAAADEAPETRGPESGPENVPAAKPAASPPPKSLPAPPKATPGGKLRVMEREVAQQGGVLSEFSQWEAGGKVLVRSQRSAGASIVSMLKPGQRVLAGRLAQGWYEVLDPRAGKGAYIPLGYVPAEALNRPGQEEPAPAQEPDAAASPLPEAEIASVPARGPDHAAPREEALPVPTPAAPAPKGSAPETAPPAEVKERRAKDGKQVEITVAPPAEGENPFVSRYPIRPKSDTVLHGFKYGIIEAWEDRAGDIAVNRIRVFLDVNVLPENTALRDFSLSLWKEKRQSGNELELLIYLPDMDPRGMAYCVASFNGRGLQEFWTRESVLFGTRFAR